MEFVIRGYPSRTRMAEWQKANSALSEQLPQLSEEQRSRAQKLRIPERAYAVALKAGELARERLEGQLDYVAGLIDSAARKRGAEVTSVVWDFFESQFRFTARENGREVKNTLPASIVDDLLLGKEGADERLLHQVDFLLGGWAD
jgi:hypothetical protein